MAPSPSPDGGRHRRLPAVTRLPAALGIWALIVALLPLGALLSPDFLGAHNLVSALQMVSLLGIVACGMMFVTYSGHYADLSAPATMSLAGFIAVSALPAGLPVALGCGLLAGVAVGLVNGVAIGYARVNPIIWTLAMAFLLDGLLRAVYGGNQIYPDGSGGAGRLFLHLAEARIGPLPLVTLVMLLLFGAGQLVLAKTRFGAGAQLTGSAYQAARLSGVAVGSVVMRAFALSALAAAIAGLFATSLNQLGGFEVGRGADFDAVTAIVLGGVALSGGSGSLAGVLGGVIVIGLGSNIMDLLGFAYQWKMVVTGAVFIAVVAATSLAARRGGDQL